MSRRVTELLADLLARYEPVRSADREDEEPPGVEAYGDWTVVADGVLNEHEDLMTLIKEFELTGDDAYELVDGFLCFNADVVARADLLVLLATIDDACELLEISGELDVHERPLVWHGTGADMEPRPRPSRPDEHVPHLVEEVAIFLQRHQAPVSKRVGTSMAYGAGIELYGAPYILVAQALDTDAVQAACDDAGVPAPTDVHGHRWEWREGLLRPSSIYELVDALKKTAPVIGFAAGFTWRNEPLQVDDAK